MKNKALKLIPMVLILTLLFVACGQEASETTTQEPAKQEATTNQMQYVSIEDLKADVESEAGEYVIIDVRKAADYETSHIVGAYSADLDAAKNGDDESGITNLKATLQEATGSETGNDEKYALVCYSGKSYAQKGTDLMIGMGIPADQIYTLEGGFTAWSEAGDDYTALIEQ